MPGVVGACEPPESLADYNPSSESTCPGGTISGAAFWRSLFFCGGKATLPRKGEQHEAGPGQPQGGCGEDDDGGQPGGGVRPQRPRGAAGGPRPPGLGELLAGRGAGGGRGLVRRGAERREDGRGGDRGDGPRPRPPAAVGAAAGGRGPRAGPPAQAGEAVEEGPGTDR